MKKYVAVLAIGSMLIFGACSPGNNFRDVKGIESQDPDLLENYNNMDKHPNLSKVCIDGVAFLTTTREYDAVTRVPEWDRTCPGFVVGPQVK